MTVRRLKLLVYVALALGLLFVALAGVFTLSVFVNYAIGYAVTISLGVWANPIAALLETAGAVTVGIAVGVMIIRVENLKSDRAGHARFFA